MMLSSLAMNLRGPWMITPEQAAIMAPILKGVLGGYLETEFDKAPAPYRVKCAELIPAPKSKANPYADKSVYVTYLTGTMMKYDDCEVAGTRTIGRDLLAADKDPDIIGHIIVADSGGGSVAAVPEMAAAIQGCKKPVVGFVDGTAASACIYALSYCRKIIAHEAMDSIGCIGTMCELSGLPKYHKDADGFITARVYADGAADKNGEYEAALEGNFQVIKEERLNPLNQQFVDTMKANRPGVADEQLTGKIYFAKDVVGSLIDGIGSLEDAVSAVMELATPPEPEPNPKHSNSMKTYLNLMAIAALAELAIAEDGSATLNSGQLEALEAALAGASGLQTTIDGLNTELATAKSTIEARDSRISELETSLNAAIEKANSAGAPDVRVNHEPEGGSADIKPSETWEDALAVCKDFLEK